MTAARPWTPGPHDRITGDEDGIDEIVLSNVAVHLERMDDRRYSLIIYGDLNDHGESGLRVQASVSVAPGRRKLVDAYLSDLEAPETLPVDDEAWLR